MASYWDNKEALSKQAIKHFNEMESKLHNETKKAVSWTRTYTDFSNTKANQLAALGRHPGPVEVILVDMTSIDAMRQFRNGKTCVLNFASYKNPGGKFIDGSSAQEESLCHQSNLYNILMRCNEFYDWNRKNLNRGLYTNRALYTHEVVDVAGGTFDILTCAAPNWGAAARNQVAKENNSAALRDRVGFALACMADARVNTLILGAFGCGVFKQDAREVATYMRDWLERIDVGSRIVFAIPDKNSKNYKAFADVFADVL